MKLLSLTLFLSLISTVISAKDYQILSPDGKIKVTVSVDKEIKYSVQYENLSVIKPSTVSFTFKQAPTLENEYLELQPQNPTPTPYNQNMNYLPKYHKDFRKSKNTPHEILIQSLSLKNEFSKSSKDNSQLCNYIVSGFSVCCWANIDRLH